MMAVRVWDKMKQSDSRECSTCHSMDSMDLSEQDKSARRRHGRAEDEGNCNNQHHQVEKNFIALIVRMHNSQEGPVITRFIFLAISSNAGIGLFTLAEPLKD